MDEGKIAWDHVIPTVPVLRGHVKLPPPQLVGCRVLWATSPKLAALRYGGGRSKGTEIADRGTRGKCVNGPSVSFRVHRARRGKGVKGSVQLVGVDSMRDAQRVSLCWSS